MKKFFDLSELCASVVNTSSFLAANMHGEPNRFWIGLLNSMLHMARNRHMIALFHSHKLSPFELQGRFPAHYDDPLVLILIVPKTRRATVRLRDNTLDCDRGFSNRIKAFFRSESSGRSSKKLST